MSPLSVLHAGYGVHRSMLHSMQMNHLLVTQIHFKAGEIYGKNHDFRPTEILNEVNITPHDVEDGCYLQSSRRNQLFLQA